MSLPSITELDQALAQSVDTFPTLWWGIYKNCIKEGFTEEQTMELLKTWIIALSKQRDT